MTSPDLGDVPIYPEQALVGDLIAETGDDEVTGPPQPDPRNNGTHVAVPMRSGGLALLRRDQLITARRPRHRSETPPRPPAPGHLDALTTLALAQADHTATPTAATRARVAEAAAHLRALTATAPDPTKRAP